jgi:hypothetical protein
MSSASFDPADPIWLAHRYDRSSDRILYRHVPRSLHASGPFLTDELIGAQPQQIVPRAAAVAGARAVAAPVHFLFHSAFCGSTVLARALDLPGHAMALSEPVLLNDVTGIRRRGELPGPEIARLLDDAMLLLARRWGPGETVVIKPSNILTGLMTPMLALRPEARALLLHAPLPDFLASVARKGLWCRLWVRELLEGFLRDGLVDLGFDIADYFRMSDLQVAAVGWLAQQRVFAALVASHPGRVVTLSAERLMADPVRAVRALGKAGFVSATAGLADAVAANGAFARHSKSGTAFSPEERSRERALADAAHGDEIAKVHDWARAVADRAGVPVKLPAPLA